MGRRGPPPTPLAVLKMRGSTLVSRRREATQVQVPPGVPRCPTWLDDQAQVAWRQLVPLLTGMGVLTRLDAQALARYCRLWSRWRKVEAFIEERGEMYPLKDESGHIKCFQQWPQVAIAAKLSQQLTRLEQEFGLTPAARARLQAPPAGSQIRDAKDRFFDAG